MIAAADLRTADRRGQQINEFVEHQRSKNILLLGDYGTAGMLRLNLIAAALRELGYEALLAQDVPDIGPFDVLQKITVLAPFCKFVVVDNSTPAGQIGEIERCRRDDWVTVILNPHGRDSSAVTRGLDASSNVILPLDFDILNPPPAVRQAVQWAEDKSNELKRKLDNYYPWRHPPGPRKPYWAG